MTKCLTINQCVECDHRIEANCSKCAGNHTLNLETNSCQCKTNPACSKGEVCVSLTGQCLDSQLCTKNPFCKTCSNIEPERCNTCVQGYQLSPNSQCEIMPCNGVKNCESCDINDSTKCEQCSEKYILNNNFCECGAGTLTGCQTDEVCTSKNTCVKKTGCLAIENCVQCRPLSPDLCLICENGYEAARNGKSCLTSLCADPNCLLCPQKSSCEGCQPNLTYSLSNFKCECVPGSKKACEPGFECSKQDKICIPKTACLGLVQDCELCWYHDTRFCETCQAGFILSNDRKQCVPQDSCKSINGCTKCVDSVPNVCEVCDSKTRDFGRACGNANLSSGAVAGIVIAVLIVIAAVIVVILIAMKKICQKKKVTSVIRDAVKVDLPGQYLQ